MITFVDTSALYALIAGDDDNHAASARTFAALVDTDVLVSHSYILLESAALVQSRMGMQAARVLLDDLAAVLEIEWVGEALHGAAQTALLAAGRRDLSLADWTSFELMRKRGIVRAFAYDADFARQGFELVG